MAIKAGIILQIAAESTSVFEKQSKRFKTNSAPGTFRSLIHINKSSVYGINSSSERSMIIRAQLCHIRLQLPGT